MTDEYSLADQIRCVGREIALRERVYPRWVDAGKMKQAVAERQLGEMRAVLETLMTLDARTTELLRHNNEEVERRRSAEAELVQARRDRDLLLG